MAQISHESGGGTLTEESLDYTHAERIAAVWLRSDSRVCVSCRLQLGHW
jgi:hypothetical protein